MNYKGINVKGINVPSSVSKLLSHLFETFLKESILKIWVYQYQKIGSKCYIEYAAFL